MKKFTAMMISASGAENGLPTTLAEFDGHTGVLCTRPGEFTAAAMYAMENMSGYRNFRLAEIIDEITGVVLDVRHADPDGHGIVRFFFH
jgi:hypothetical protein